MKLGYDIYEKAPQLNEAVVVDNKRLGAVLNKNEEELLASTKLTRREKERLKKRGT